MNAVCPMCDKCGREFSPNYKGMVIATWNPPDQAGRWDDRPPWASRDGHEQWLLCADCKANWRGDDGAGLEGWEFEPA